MQRLSPVWLLSRLLPDEFETHLAALCPYGLPQTCLMKKITQLDSCSEIDTCSLQTWKVLVACDISHLNIVRCHQHESSIKQHLFSLQPSVVMRQHFITLHYKPSRIIPNGMLLSLY